MTDPTLTTGASAPVGYKQNSQTAGPLSPVLTEGPGLIEKLPHKAP
jgi:catalase